MTRDLNHLHEDSGGVPRRGTVWSVGFEEATEQDLPGYVRALIDDSVRLDRASVSQRWRVEALRPQAIIAPLLSHHFDAIELASELHGLGYAGRLVFVAETVPNPDVIRAEIAQAAPGAAVDLILADRPAQLRAV